MHKDVLNLKAMRDENDNLIYAGKVGAGFNDDGTTSLLARLQHTVSGVPQAFTSILQLPKGATSVAPELVIEVEFLGRIAREQT